MPTDREMPRGLLDAADDDARPARRAWTAALPSLDALAARWSLDVGRPFQPGGATAWVAPARTTAGERVVLKVGWRHDEALHEADGLRAWDGREAVGLLDAATLEDTSALLEACEPGTPLSDVAEDEQDRVLASLLPRLWIAPPPRHPFRPLQAMCDAWADAFEVRSAEAGPSAEALDPGLARAGIDLLRELPRSAPRHVLLATDLHAGNVLAATREPWLAIDPKPYVGDPAYDVTQHALNCVERLAADPPAFAHRMAGLSTSTSSACGQSSSTRRCRRSLVVTPTSLLTRQILDGPAVPRAQWGVSGRAWMDGHRESAPSSLPPHPSPSSAPTNRTGEPDV